MDDARSIVAVPRSNVHAINGGARGLQSDYELERMVLGCAILDETARAIVESILKAGDFDDKNHYSVFVAISALSARGVGIDIGTLADELRAMEVLAQVGGTQFLGSLTDNLPTVAHVEEHAKILSDLSVTRTVGRAAKAIAIKACDPSVRAEQLVEFATGEMFKATERRAASSPTSVADVINESMEAYEKRKSAGKTPGLSTGFQSVNQWMSGRGFLPGKLYIIGAPPGTGKSALVTNIALHVAESGSSVLMFSLEMKRAEIGDRMLCIRAKVDGRRFDSNQCEEPEIQRLVAAAGPIYDMPIYIDDSDSLTLVELRAKAMRHKRQHGLGLVIVDFLQFLSMPGEQEESTQIAAASRALKILSNELEVPILAVAALNRDSSKRHGDKRPIMSDLRGSSAIESNADSIAFLYRDELVNPNTEDAGIAEYIIRKQRGAPFPRTVRLKFTAEHTRFDDLEEQLPAMPAGYSADQYRAFNEQSESEDPNGF